MSIQIFYVSLHLVINPLKKLEIMNQLLLEAKLQDLAREMKKNGFPNTVIQNAIIELRQSSKSRIGRFVVWNN